MGSIDCCTTLLQQVLCNIYFSDACEQVRLDGVQFSSALKLNKLFNKDSRLPWVTFTGEGKEVQNKVYGTELKWCKNHNGI